MSVGLVITFVGLGDKGFKTLELKLVGPCLVGCGLFCVFLQVLYCTVPACMTNSAKTEESEKLLKNEDLLNNYLQILHSQKNGFEKHNSDIDGNVLLKPESTHTFDTSIIKQIRHQRPVLRAARQKLSNSYSDEVFLDQFSASPFHEDGTELVHLQTPADGSAQNLHQSDIIVNSSRLFGNREF